VLAFLTNGCDGVEHVGQRDQKPQSWITGCAMSEFVMLEAGLSIFFRISLAESKQEMVHKKC